MRLHGDTRLFHQSNDQILMIAKLSLWSQKAPRVWCREIARYLTSILTDKYKIMDLGTPTSFLNIQIKISDNYFKIHQSQYIEEILKRFGMSDAAWVSTPIGHQTRNSLNPMENEEFPLEKIDIIIYQSIVGALMYITVHKAWSASPYHDYRNSVPAPPTFIWQPHFMHFMHYDICVKDPRLESSTSAIAHLQQ